MKKNNEIKKTQGHLKMVQYLEDLKRNKYLMGKIRKFPSYFPANPTSEEEARQKFQEELFNKYREFESMAKEGLEKYPESFDAMFEELAEDYGIDDDLIGMLVMAHVVQKESVELGDIHDMCILTDSYDENLNEVYGPPSPIQINYKKRAHIRAYPISIDINKFASKRDVLDFIEKRWDIIENYLSTYRNKKPRFRKRAIDRKLTDLIWDNRNKKLKEIKTIIDERFPENTLVDHEIYKIIGQEKIRRGRKINVGR